MFWPLPPYWTWQKWRQNEHRDMILNDEFPTVRRYVSYYQNNLWLMWGLIARNVVKNINARHSGTGIQPLSWYVSDNNHSAILGMTGMSFELFWFCNLVVSQCRSFFIVTSSGIVIFCEGSKKSIRNQYSTRRITTRSLYSQYDGRIYDLMISQIW